MEKGKSIFLKIAVILLGLPVLAIGATGIPWLFKHPVNPTYDQMIYPVVAGLYATTIPYLLALYQTFKLLSYIETSEAFSLMSVESLGAIKRCAFLISGIYLVMMPFVFGIAELDDAPGLILVGGVPVFASLAVAVFAAILEKLLQEALELKFENQLTI